MYSLCQRNKARGIKTWYVRYTDPESGLPTYRSLGTDKKSSAQQVLLQWQMEMQEKKNAETDEKVSVPIVQSLIQYEEHYEAMKAKPGTIYNLTTFKKTLLKFCKASRVENVEDFTLQMAERYLGQWKDAKGSTYRKKLQIARTFFKWVIDRNDMDIKNVFLKVKAPKASLVTDRSYWTPEQIAAIIEKADTPKRRLLYAFQAYAGLRFFEARKVQWEDIRDGYLHVLGKGDKSARVPIGSKLAAEIERFLKRCGNAGGYMFNVRTSNTEENRKLKENLDSQDFKADGPVHLHRFRHSFASNLLIAGVNVVVVSKLMRHENVNITLKYYAHCLPDNLREGVEML